MFFDRAPDRVNARPSPRPGRLVRQGIVRRAEEIVEFVRARAARRVAVESRGGSRPRVWTMLREWRGGRLLFLQSQDRTAAQALAVSVAATGRAVLWDCAGGGRSLLAAESAGGRVRFDLDMPPSGSALITIGVPNHYALGRALLSKPKHVLTADREIRNRYKLAPRGVGDHQPGYL